MINYSPRFTLRSMTGTFPPAVIQGLRTVTGTSGPADVNNIQAPQAGAGAGVSSTTTIEDSMYEVPYTMQTDSIRYAPMPPMAQTKITAKNAAPQFPTSAYTVYQKIAGLPDAVTTETKPLDFSVVSREATVGDPLGDFRVNEMLTYQGCRGWPTQRHCVPEIPEPMEGLRTNKLRK